MLDLIAELLSNARHRLTRRGIVRLNRQTIIAANKYVFKNVKNTCLTVKSDSWRWSTPSEIFCHAKTCVEKVKQKKSQSAEIDYIKFHHKFQASSLSIKKQWT